MAQLCDLVRALTTPPLPADRETVGCAPAVLPLYVRARLRVTGAYGSKSDVRETPMRSSPAKIAAEYLGSYLESRDRASARGDD
jgi:hypothetical protein